MLSFYGVDFNGGHLKPSSQSKQRRMSDSAFKADRQCGIYIIARTTFFVSLESSNTSPKSNHSSRTPLHSYCTSQPSIQKVIST